MLSDELKKRHVPYCTICLVLAAFTSHLCVLLGNLETASALSELGSSTRGWSHVGLGIAQSLEHELDQKMSEVSMQLLTSLSHISFVQDAMETFISIVGNETDASVANATALLGERNPHWVALVQQGDPDPLQALMPLIASSVHNVIETVQNKVATLLHELLELLKPALKQVAEWLNKFGETIQNSIEAFSVTLDRVQKIFDQVMQQLNGHGENGDTLLDETISLFNVDNSGDISADDLSAVADLYSITALKDDKAQELVKKYDSSGDGELQYEEMEDLISDPSVPDLMTVVLRTYARRMSEVAGVVKSARMRDEVALAVTQYLGLVCSKNLTRAAWVADALGNGSVPLPFTADVMAQLCLTSEDPSFMTSADTGQLMVQFMYELHAGHTLQAVDLLSNLSFWVSEGFDAEDQPYCLKMVTQWLTAAKMSTTRPPSSFESSSPKGAGHNTTILQILAGDTHDFREKEILLAMPATAQQLAEEGVVLYRLEEHRTRQKERERLFSSSGSQLLITHLLGGVAPGDSGSPSSTKQAVSSGTPARPESLLFARWLANNATSRADDYQAECFDYSTQSSSAMDSFATQIKAMVARVEGFLNVMVKYATPAAIDRLEGQVEDFITNAMSDVMKVVEETMVHQLNQSLPLVEGAVRHAAHEAGERLGHAIGDALGSPMGKALKDPIQDVVGKLAENSPASTRIGAVLGDRLAETISKLSSKILGEQVGGAMEDLVVAGLEAAGEGISDQLHLGLLQEQAQSKSLPVAVTGVWEKMADMLKKLVNMLPSATSTLKYARKEVAKLYANLNSIFQTFDRKGASVFASISSLWRVLWTVYFIVLVSLYPFILFYACWCRGFFGGPQPLSPEEEEAYQHPQSFRENCAACCRSCSMCMKVSHDTSTCMWSVVILIQVIALVVFLISIVLCLLAGVKAFISAGCASIYVINDSVICAETLMSLRDFLSTFVVLGTTGTLKEACEEDSLLACNLLAKKMAHSTILTTVFSMLAAVLTLQMIFEMAINHEQARWRRIVNKRISEESQPSQLSG